MSLFLYNYGKVDIVFPYLIGGQASETSKVNKLVKMGVEQKEVQEMTLLKSKSLSQNGGVIRNSYYDVRKPYSNQEMDSYRIAEGYSKEIRINFDKKKHSEGR